MSEILTDAWRTLVPDRSDTADRHGPLPPIMAALTIVTGFIDSYSYLILGHVLVANMTGNVVFSGFAVAGTSGFSLPASAAALLAFSAGALLTGRVVRNERGHRGRLLYHTVRIEFMLVAAGYFVARFAPSPAGNEGIKYLLIVLLAVGMGVQNAFARALAVPDLTTTVLTMTITGTSADSRLAGGAGGKAGRRLLSVLAMFLGASLGALFVHVGHSDISLLCAGVLLAAATYAARRTLASRDAWTAP